MPRDYLYRQLAEKLIRSIASGAYPVGNTLPGELEIAAKEKVSRHTVRAALKILEQYGLIRRTPRVGTVVIQKGALLNFDRELSTLSDLDRLAVRNPRRILDIREIVPDTELAERLKVPGRTPLIRFSMIRLGASDEEPPIAWTIEYVRRSWYDLMETARKYPDLLMIELIERLYRVRCVEVRQIIEATALTAEGAKNLQALEGSPCLRIRRNYVDRKGGVLLATNSYHPGDRYAFNLTARTLSETRKPREKSLFLKMNL